jgi:hypothetical protein
MEVIMVEYIFVVGISTLHRRTREEEEEDKKEGRKVKGKNRL